MAKSPPDGYTLLISTSASFGTSPSLFRNLGYDPRKDFEPVGLIAATPNLLVVHPSFPARTVAELIAVGRAATTPIPYGSPGVGTLNHLTGELVAWRTGMKMTHVPYKGAGPALNDLVGGHIKLLFSAVTTSHSQIAAETVVPLAVTGAKRAALMPEVPTFAEAGLPDIDVPLRMGIVAPAGTPRRRARQAQCRAQHRARKRGGARPPHLRRRRAAARYARRLPGPHRPRSLPVVGARQGGRHQAGGVSHAQVRLRSG